MGESSSVAEPTDEALLDAARAGDKGALEGLLKRYQQKVYRFGMKMCRHPQDAEDVVQETLMAAARTVQSFRGSSSVTTWLYAIARNSCRKMRRKSKFAPDREESLDEDRGRQGATLQVADPRRSPEDAAVAVEVEAALKEAIWSLDPKYREVLVLRDVEGLTAPEVAEVLGLGVAAVKSRLHRARSAVRERVAPVLGAPEAASEPQPSCPDLVEMFSRYLEDEISPEQCAQMEKHLEDCRHCQGACSALKRTLALCRDAPQPKLTATLRGAVQEAVEAFVAMNR